MREFNIPSSSAIFLDLMIIEASLLTFLGILFGAELSTRGTALSSSSFLFSSSSSLLAYSGIF